MFYLAVRLPQRVLSVIVITIFATSLGAGGSLTSTASITLSPRDSIQDAVVANPPGTTFVLQPGIYREAGVSSMKDGDSFVGRPGAILDGAKLVEAWARVSILGREYWTAAGGIPLSSPRCPAHAPCCLPAYPGCNYVQDLYFDNANYRHVISLVDVGPGAWYYDFDGADGGLRNNIYLAPTSYPNSHTVELGHVYYAFTGRAANVTIRNLLIEKYAAPIQSAAIQPEGPDWLIQNNEIRLNHGFGIKAKVGGDNIRVLGNNVDQNGEMGIGTGKVEGGLWDSNQVAYNNIDGVNPGFEAGGSKFVGNHITISNNLVHDNYGPGLWSDEGATYNTYDHNKSYKNYGGGIRYEISRWGIIKNNKVYENTRNAQIVYTGSDHGRIIGNIVTNDAAGGIFVQNIVGDRSRATIYKVVDTQVIGNTIVISNRARIAAGMLDFARPPEAEIFQDPSNFFDDNVYQLSGSLRFAALSSGPVLGWGENSGRGPRRVTWPQWQADGQDSHGTILSSPTAPNW